MKRSTAQWTTAIAAAAIFSLPVGSQAQTPQQQPAAQAAQPDAQSESSPQVHIRKAEEALSGIESSAIEGRAKSRINELKQHLNKLERASAGSQSWQKDAAEADRILSELIGQGDAASASGAVGTTGSTASSPAPKSASKSEVKLDESARAKLTEVRSHLTAFAAAMSGSPAAASEAPASASASAQPSSSSTPAASTASPAPASTPQPTASGTPGATGTSGAAGAAAAGMTGAASTQPPASTTPQQPTASAEPQAGEVDQDAAKKHLTDARNSLSAMTQLPAASQLTGDARTQVSELISNFNSLITTPVDWPAAYAKVEGNLNALLGAQTTDEGAARTTGTAGAVGTSGSVTVDPEIRAKLTEFRNHLQLFEKAAGGAGEAAATAPAGAPSTTSASTPSPSGTTMTPTPSTPSTSSATSPATPPTAATQPETAAAGQTGAISRDEALQHLQAIESILGGEPGSAPSATGTSGTPTGSGAPVNLDAAKVQQLRTHLAELKRILGQK